MLNTLHKEHTTLNEHEHALTNSKITTLQLLE